MLSRKPVHYTHRNNATNRSNNMSLTLTQMYDAERLANRAFHAANTFANREVTQALDNASLILAEARQYARIVSESSDHNQRAAAMQRLLNVITPAQE